MSAFHFELLSPEALLYSSEVQSVIVPGVEGELTALPEHAPLLSSLKIGILSVFASSGVERFFVKGGVVEVTSESMIILTQESFPLKENDRSFLQEKIKIAEGALEKGETEEIRQAAREVLACLRMV